MSLAPDTLLAMSPKVPLPLSRRKMVAGAFVIAQQILQNEEVRRRLAQAPRQVIDWAGRRRANAQSTRAGFTARFGQKGLQRRVDSLADVVNRALPRADDPGRAEMLQAVEQLRIALAIAGPMPIVQRKKAHSRIDHQLDELEAALVDAVLPPA
jgi:hypothetical protein